MADTYLYRTQGTPTNAKKFTLSMWLKRGKMGTWQRFYQGYQDTNNRLYITFKDDDTINIYGTTASSVTMNWTSLRVFRDPTAWMNLVFKGDSTQVSAGDRFKVFINGIDDSANWTQTATIAQDVDFGNCLATATDDLTISGHQTQDDFFDGSMSHYIFTDGTAYDASTFGETDSTSGIWKIKTSPSVTYGDNGYFLKMEDRTNLDLDSSPNALTFTTGGTGLTATYDNPSNNFSTMNPLDNYYADSTFSNGNNTIATASSVYTWNTGTMGLGAGLWYFEIKIATGVTSNYHNIGVATKPSPSSTIYLGDTNYSWAYVGNDGKIWTNTSGTAYGDTFTTGDIMGVYLDLTASKLYFAKNGTIQDSGTGFDITAVGSTDTRLYFPAAGDWGASYQGTFDFNFGNGYFGTTEIASPETDEGGIGAFKYNPSTGTFDGSSKDFRAICTKNIITYG